MNFLIRKKKLRLVYFEDSLCNFQMFDDIFESFILNNDLIKKYILHIHVPFEEIVQKSL